MTTLARSRAQVVGRMPRPGGAAVRKEPTGSGFAGLATRILIVAGLILTAWQGWSHFTAEAPAPARTAVPAEAIAGVQITLGQAALALRDFGKGGLLSDRFDFEQNMSRVRRSVETLEGSASENDERQALGRAKSQLERLVQIEKEHIGRVDAGGGAMGTQKLAEIATLRDGAALALADFREVGVRRVAAAEPDSLGRLLRGSAGAGAGLLSLCIGAIALWSRLFPA
jgi:hypothetical protein